MRKIIYVACIFAFQWHLSQQQNYANKSGSSLSGSHISIILCIVINLYYPSVWESQSAVTGDNYHTVMHNGVALLYSVY